MHARPIRWTALCAALLLCASCGGGGGGAPSFAIDLGLVSGTEPTFRVVQATNTLTEPAAVSWPNLPGPFGVNIASLPTGLVPAGADFDVEVFLIPAASGVLESSVRLALQGATQLGDAVVPLRAEVEEVRVFAFGADLDFGTVAFGAEATRAMQLSNVSTLSVVRYTSADFPSPDFEVVSPALPFALSPGARQTVTVRVSPFRRMAPTDATSRLRPASVQGGVDFRTRVTPAAGRKVIDLGLFGLTNDRTDVITFDVPGDVWSIHVAAWRPGHPYPDYLGTGGGPHWSVENIRAVLFESPSGFSYSGPYRANGLWAMTLPRTLLPRDQPESGTYRLQLEVADGPPADTELAVRVVLKATPGGSAPTTGVLDLNVFLGDVTGVTPASAPSDTTLQNALQAANTMLQQVGISFGSINYYQVTEATGGGPTANDAATVRAGLPAKPGVVPDRLNYFVLSGFGGHGGWVPGPYCAYTNHSVVLAGYDAVNLPYLLVHEALHHLGLYHVAEDGLADTNPGLVPANIMDPFFAQAGTYISPQQGTIVRAHPFIR